MAGGEGGDQSGLHNGGRRVGAGDREGSYAGNEVVIEGEKYSAVRCIDLLRRGGGKGSKITKR